MKSDDTLTFLMGNAGYSNPKNQVSLLVYKLLPVTFCVELVAGTSLELPGTYSTKPSSHPVIEHDAGDLTVNGGKAHSHPILPYWSPLGQYAVVLIKKALSITQPVLGLEVHEEQVTFVEKSLKLIKLEY